MKIVATMLARNEDWIIGMALDAALRWCDEVVVLNHNSTDSTRTIAARFANGTAKVIVRDWEEGEHWREMDARQYALDEARKRGATHIAIVDADEALTHNNLGSVRGWFERLAPGECVDVPMVIPWKSLDEQAMDIQSIITLGFMDKPGLCWKPRGEEAYHHHNRPPIGSQRGETLKTDGGCFHFQWADFPRKTWKDRHYMMTERLRWNYPPQEINTKYHWYDALGKKLAPIPAHWWGNYSKSAIRLGGEPWYVAECKRLVAQHGAARFEGLDLYGMEL